MDDQSSAWVGVLGPVVVRTHNRHVEPESVVGRALLGALALAAPAPVSRRRLITDLWDTTGTAGERGAEGRLAVAVCRLRRWLYQAVDPVPEIVTTAEGYALRAVSTDAQQFLTLVREAAALPAHQAYQHLVRATGLWRGPLLDNVPPDRRSRAGVLALEAERVEALLHRGELALELGLPEQALAAVGAHCRDNPLDERGHAVLIGALGALGRQAEAIQHYTRLIAQLRGEYGVDPGERLTQAYLRLLRGQPRPVGTGASPVDLPAVDPPPLDVPARPAAPCLLPPPLDDFTGRGAETRRITHALAAGRRVITVSGLGGVGKTSLAVTVAHAVRGDHPDGQLYADLRATHPMPVRPYQVHGWFLRALGVAAAADPQERANRYRAETADRRLLVVLDNAVDEAQVRPLLPGGASAAIVTSRRRLPNVDSAHPVDLDVMTTAEALVLLCRIVGRARISQDLATAAWIVRLCGHLPLAVRVAGARVASRPDWSLAYLAGQLADEGQRLDRLRLGDRDVRDCLARSYDWLPPMDRRAFRVLSLLDGPAVTGWMVAALLDVPDEVGEDLLEALADANLLRPVGTCPGGRPLYRIPELLRLLATDLLVRDERPDEVGAALGRLDLARLDRLPSRSVRPDPVRRPGHRAVAVPRM